MSVEGELRVWHTVNPPSDPEFFDADTIDEAMDIIEQILQTDLDELSVYSNAVGVEIFKLGSWEEFYDDDGNDIDDLMACRDMEDL